MLSKFYLISSCSLLSNLVWAQTSDPTSSLPTIVIQAQNTDQNVLTTSASTKFTHDVLDTPSSRSFLSQEALKQQDVQRIDDALNQVSGVFSQTNYGGGFWDNFSFRGFSTDPNIGPQIIRNGLSVNRGLSASRDMVNIESLEFLKGPMAALYGRGETGGLLNINTKKPAWESSNEINLRANSLEKYRASFEHTAPINDQLAYRFAIAHEDNQSFRDYVSNSRWFFSPQLSWKLSDRTQLDLDTEFTRVEGLFDRGISAYQKQIVMNPKTYTGEPSDGDHLQTDNFYQIRLTHELNDDWKVKSAVSVKDSLLKGFSSEPRRIQSDARTLERQRRYRDNKSDDVLFQTEMLGTIQQDWAKHEILLSAETGQMKYRQLQLRRNHSSDSPNIIDIYQPTYGKYLPNLPLFIDTEDRQKYFAFNVQDQIFLNDQWSVLLGLRFDHVTQEFVNKIATTSNQKDLQQTSPRFGLNYRLNDAWSVYANYGQSFAINSGMDRNNQTFDPEKGQSYEIGSKYQLNPQSLISIALFKMDKENVLTTDPIDNNFQITAGEVSSQGIELDVETQLNDQLSLRANYSYTDAQIEKDQTLAEGSRLSNVPKHSGSISTNYEWTLSNNSNVGVGATAVYVGKRSGHSADNGFNLPEYTLINLNAYYAPREQIRYQFNLHNLLDKTYYTASYSEMWIQPGEPLNASLAVQWKF
ncbi:MULTISPECIES: TonB-dependent siderophore receptor [Acinetobacter]|uniref:TonB-dependent siderophore receptor n=1 Tax=Acinetobacter TaxID=469 RepID=UPI001906707A|nr:MULTISPECIES: TonB-dependent siderophore receptor [Acinetobacter]MBJ9371982.1 TonB-dependent siderophore receptor [Acinetobacter sp. TGL-Y2]MCU4437295.1 TonB-dependent siderophore receptor [Acinetobacter bereziniae]